MIDIYIYNIGTLWENIKLFVRAYETGRKVRQAFLGCIAVSHLVSKSQ